MAIFGFNFDKAGKGINKGNGEKNILFTYLESFKRNFWNLLQVNILYVISSIPMILILFLLFSMFIYPNIAPLISEYMAGAAESLKYGDGTYIGIFMVIFISGILLMLGSGPASAALSYALRNYQREEHVWVWADFKAKFKENFKQAIIVAAIDVIALPAVMIALSFYASLYKSSGSALWLVIIAAVIVVCAVYSLMHVYIYQFMVTFDNKLSVIYKNSLILTVAKLPQNLLLTAFYLVLTYYIFTSVHPILSAVLMVAGWYTVVKYPMEFYAARTIKNIIDLTTKGTEN